MQEWGGLLNPLELTGCLMRRQQSRVETTLCGNRDTGTTPCEDTEQCYMRVDSQNDAMWARHMGRCHMKIETCGWCHERAEETKAKTGTLQFQVKTLNDSRNQPERNKS